MTYLLTSLFHREQSESSKTTVHGRNRKKVSFRAAVQCTFAQYQSLLVISGRHDYGGMAQGSRFDGWCTDLSSMRSPRPSGTVKSSQNAPLAILRSTCLVVSQLRQLYLSTSGEVAGRLVGWVAVRWGEWPAVWWGGLPSCGVGGRLVGWVADGLSSMI